MEAPQDPLALVSQSSLFSFLEDLTSIEVYSGWRNSASTGEAEAIDYVERRLNELAYLDSAGLTVERQDFRVFLGTELWDTRLHLIVGGMEREVPADGLRGPRDSIAQALRFDSDGVLNDSLPNPVSVKAPTILIRSADEVRQIRPDDVHDKVVFLDYAAIDRIVQGSAPNAVQVATELVSKSPAAVVLVTSFSNVPGESHGTFVGDVSALNWVESRPAPPVLYVRLEDLGLAGIMNWQDLARVEAARLVWDADVFSPARSGNLVARIPGHDPSRALILGAHIDSPNSPGAMDDGSGSVLLLEVARVLDRARIRPPTDLYLVWFGSEELGLYGSSHFAATHQDLLDHAQAMLQVDMLSYPLDGIDAELSLVAWSYDRFGDARLLWPGYLSQAAARQDLTTVSEDLNFIYSDNSSFLGFDVPNADLAYVDEESMDATGSVHYAAHIHDPYDTAELAREKGDILQDMTRLVLAGILELPPDPSSFRVTPPADRRALFIASHTESVHMTPGALIELGMTLAWAGFDVDLIPYGETVTTNDLQDADLVFALPVLDYPSPEGDPGQYDEEWSPGEIAMLERYVTDGGFLVITNSAHRLKYANTLLDPNEDWRDMDSLAQRFGVTFQSGQIVGSQARAQGDHPLVQSTSRLRLAEGNAVPFTITDGLVLAEADEVPVAALVDHSDGQVLILADLALLGSEGGPPANVTFWDNLARYARQ